MNDKSGPCYRRVTELIGRASGDHECFRFDSRTRSQELADRKLRDIHEKCRRDGDAQTYPNELLPAEAYEDSMLGRRGKFRITVEFLPEDVL